MKKIIVSAFLIFLFIRPGQLLSEMVPTGYSSWYSSENPSKRAIEFGGAPSNYWNGNSWIANDPSFEPSANGYRSTRNRHFVFVDTLNDIVCFALSDHEGNVHVLKTKIGPLFFYNRITLDTIRLASPNLSGYALLDDKIELPEIYPGVACYIWNGKAGLEQQFIFSPMADTLIDRVWRDAGSDSNIFTVNAIKIFVDSLNLQMRDNDGLFEPFHSREIAGDIDLLGKEGSSLLRMPRGFVEQDSLRAPLFRCLQRYGSQSWLLEGFRNVDLISWPQNGYQHNDSRTWLVPGVDTYISGTEPGSSFYNSAVLTAYRDATLGFRQRGLIWFQSLIDSLRNAAVIDSALLQVHYYGDVIANGTLRICRGIADSSWYNSGRATWNARYKLGSDSLKWTGGWATHTSSFSATNSVSVNLSDTSSTGWYRFSCKSVIADIKSSGTDWGFWVDSGFGSDSQRASFDSAENPSKAPRLYLVYRLGGGRARKLKLEE